VPGRAESRLALERVYCVVPRDLAPLLHELLRRHFQADSTVDVIVEQRHRERRTGGERRAAELDLPAAGERRLVKACGGRRVGDRRAIAVPVGAPPLPRRARRYADQVLFVERLEPSTREQEDLDTARLVLRIQAGESDLFSLLYLRYFDRVYGYLRVALDDPHEAEDTAQQVFINVLRALPRYELRSQPFRAWLFTIVRNLAVTGIRRRYRVELADPTEIDRHRDRPVAEESDLSALDWISDRELLMFVERLGLLQRQVLVLRYMMGLSNSEIARILDRSTNEVAVIHHRATSFLRDRLAALGRAPTHGRRSRMARCRPKARVLRSRRFALLG
jgi:RNA polymerase sigma factor (sigma-70 family)